MRDLVARRRVTVRRQGIVGQPIFSPAPGAYSAPKSLSMSFPGPVGAAIRYTDDDSIPSESSPLYTGPITLTPGATKTYKARGFLSGWTPSGMTTGTYTISAPVGEWDSHPPHRALPSAVSKALRTGPLYYVSLSGVDAPGGGTAGSPWKTLSYACSQPISGTLYLRAGIHRWYGSAVASKANLTIESYPNELAIIDFGLPEFYDSPTTAWEPAPRGTGSGYLVNQANHAINNTTVTVDTGTGTILPDDTFTVPSHAQVYTVVSFASNVITYTPGAKSAFADNAAITLATARADEYRSTATYTSSQVEIALAGLFTDSWLALNRYRFISDLRSTNEFFKSGLDGFQSSAEGLWGGPGLHWSSVTGRIRFRGAHTAVPFLDTTDYLEIGANFTTNNYKGETDPRTMQLVVNRKAEGARLSLNASGITLRDVVVRGADEPVSVNASNCHLDNVWIYQGAGTGFVVDTVSTGFVADGLKLRGCEAPWMSRFHGKNRTTKPFLAKLNADGMRFIRPEVTDGHDTFSFGAEGLVVENFVIKYPTFDNCNDDILDMGWRQVQGTKIVLRPKFTRCGTHISMTSGGAGRTPGDDLFILYPFFDFRHGSYGRPPDSTDQNASGLNIGRLIGEHGSGGQPPNIYILYPAVTSIKGSDTKSTYLGDLVHFNPSPAKRRVFNGIWIQDTGPPKQNLPTAGSPPVVDIGDMEFGGWVIYALSGGAGTCSLSGSRTGQVATDKCMDPKLMAHTLDHEVLTDVRLQAGSPAIGAGLAPINGAWPDPLSVYRTQNESGPIPVALDYLTMDEFFGINAVALPEEASI